MALPGASNRFDYTSIDSARERLYIAHMNADELLVFDVKRRRVIRRVAAAGVHGVIAVPQLGRVFALATDDHQVLTLDSRTGKVLARAPAGSYPDGLAYDPVERHVFVSDESGGVESVIDARGKRIATVQLGGEAGNVQYDAPMLIRCGGQDAGRLPYRSRLKFSATFPRRARDKFLSSCARQTGWKDRDGSHRSWR